jgi:hypothetical protein
MDDTDPTPDVQNRRRKDSRSSDTSDDQSGDENLKRKKRKAKKVQISILISIRKLLKENTESPTSTPTLNVIHVEDKMDFHIDTNFYKDLIEQARKTLQKGDICKQLDQENRPYSLDVPECTYQVSAFKYDKIPMPINAYFRQTCKDPHYDSTNTGTPATHITLTFECRAEAPTSTSASITTNGPNKAQQEALKSLHKIAKRYFKQPGHTTTQDLSMMLHNYIQQTGTGQTPHTSSSDDRPWTPPPPAMMDKSTRTPEHWPPQQRPTYTPKRTPTPRNITGPSTSTSQGKRRRESPHRHRQEKHPVHWKRDIHYKDD